MKNMVSEAKKKEIEKGAKGILDKFASALENVKIEKKEFKKEAGGYRAEGEGKKCDMEFRKGMFENAPKTKGDCIVAEKKKW